MLRSQRLIFIFAFIFIIVGAAWWLWPVAPAYGVQAAAKTISPTANMFAEPYSESFTQAIFEDDGAVRTLLANRRHEFIQAVPLAPGEAQNWASVGCDVAPCAHLLYYNYDDKGTIEGVINLSAQTVVDVWQDRGARPLAHTRNLDTAVTIAAADERVTSVLGDLSAADLMMVPMNIWLLDDSCLNDWCVDLTFHDPAGSGKIFHVTVNMEQGAVARTFYTRGRPSRPYRDITPQRNAYSDGCHEAGGWSVCWEMTAHDGLNFYDAEFDEKTIFSSAKIGQVEVWYPSWPGGYRDEIGFSASVPPYFGTELEELDNGFVISQLFTEFIRWPNCICCYRYEQIMAFFDDGSFEARFVSHGPGCDDLSIYQPMWRFDMDLADPSGDEVWVWDTDSWREVEQEEEFELILDRNVSPDGQKVATFDDDLHYRWRYLPSDPLGLDEAKMFVVRWGEQEGENPIITGPANTFQPPRQWINEEPVSGDNVVIWYVPLLKTKKGGPWFCMPEPADDVTPCEAVLRVEPAGALPTADELAEQLAAAEETPPPTPRPRPTVNPEGQAVADANSAATQEQSEAEIEGDTIEDVILNAGCAACHVIGPIGDHGKVGPELTEMAAVADQRVAGQSAREYVRTAILNPNAYIVADCPNGPCLADVMPDYYGQRLSAGQLEAIIDYLLDEELQPDAEPIADNPDPAGAPEIRPTRQLPQINDNTVLASTATDRSLMIAIIAVGAPLLLLIGWLLGRRRWT